MSASRIEQAAFVPWGTAESALAPDYQPQVSGGFQLSARARQRPRPVLLRLDPAGGFHLWSPAAGAIVALGADGAYAGRTAVPDAARVIDVAAGADRDFVLYAGTVRCLDRKGAELWNRAVTGNRLVLAGASLFVAGAQPKLTELRASDGGVVQEHAMKQAFIRPFAAGGALVGATYFEAQERRGVVVYDPATRKETSAVGPAELYGPLLSAVGADRERHLYLYGTALGVSVPSLFEVGTDAKQIARDAIESVVIDKDEIDVVTAGADRFELRVFARGAAERAASIDRPAALRPGKDQRTQVVGKAGGRLLVDVLDIAGGLAERYAVDASGKAEAVPGATVDVHGAQPLDTWQVGDDGAVYIPVTSADGLSIVRVVI